MSLIDIGVSGLRVQQTALSVTGQNITNASTPGYSRQRVEVVPQNAGTDGSRFRGAGARVVDIERLSDQFVSAQVRADDSMRSELATLSTQIQAVDGLLFNETNGLDNAFDQFFSALNDANAVPDSVPERQLLLDAADNLAAQFNSLNDQLNAQNQGVTATMETAAGQINELAESIALLNRRLSDLGDSSLSGAANQLLDERDVQLQALSRLVSLKVVEQEDQQLSVFIGKGQALVLGAISQDLAMGPNQQVLLRADNGKLQPVTKALTGGEIGGALRFKETVLTPAMQRLGQLAHTFVQSFNTEHQRGIDLQGQPGRNFFKDVNFGASSSNRTERLDLMPNASGSVSINVEDAKATVLSDYRLDFAEQGNGAFSIRRLSDQSLVAQGRHTGAGQSLSFDGLTVTLGADGFEAGQAYLLTPLRQGASDVQVNIDTVAQIALASPARSNASISNQGDAQLQVGAVLDPQHPILQGEGDLRPPLLVRFVGTDRFDLLDNSDPTAPRALDPPIRSQRYLPELSEALALGSPGSARIYSDAEMVGELQPVTDLQALLPTLGNGYTEQTVTFDSANAEFGSPVSVQIPAGVSAAASAEMLNRVPGVNATAYTDLVVQSLTRSALDVGPAIHLGGESLEDVRDLDDLVSRINANPQLKESGIRATLEDGQARLTDVAGEDLEIKLSGPSGSGIRVGGENGDSVDLSGAGVGDPAVIQGSQDLRSGFDFSNGGPYSLTVTLGDSTTALTLDQPYATADALVFAIQNQLDQSFGTGQVSAGLSGGGQLRLVSGATGAGVALMVAPNTAMADALGLSNVSATGNDRYQATAIGGQVALLLDPGRSFSATGGGPFQSVPMSHRGDLGFEFELTGRPAVGDEFSIDFNASGTLDNRNGLALTELQSAPMVGDPPATVTETFASLVQFVGAKGSQAATDQQAAEALLAQSEARRESISGVNLDEEAANLIRFEQGYNAAAQVISVARDVFNVLFNAVS